MDGLDAVDRVGCWHGVDGALAASQAPAECVGAGFSTDRPHTAHLDKQGGDVIFLLQSWTKNSSGVVRCDGPLVALHVDAVDELLPAGRHEVEGPVLSTFDELMIHVVPTVNMIILLQECMFLVTPYLCDHGKPILMSGVVLQAELVFHCSL